MSIQDKIKLLSDDYCDLARYLETMTPKIVASSLGVSLVYPLGQDDVCTGFTNTQCPIVAQEKVNYQYKLTIPAIFPEV